MMKPAEWLQEIKKMRFEEAYSGRMVACKVLALNIRAALPALVHSDKGHLDIVHRSFPEHE